MSAPSSSRPRSAAPTIGGEAATWTERPGLASIERGLAEVSPGLSVHVAASPPIVGAALLGLDELGADTAAQARLRRDLTAAVEGLERGAGLATVHGGTDG